MQFFGTIIGAIAVICLFRIGYNIGKIRKVLEKKYGKVADE